MHCAKTPRAPRRQGKTGEKGPKALSSLLGVLASLGVLAHVKTLLPRRARRPRGVGQQQGRLLALVVEDHVRDAVLVEVEHRHPAGVEDLLIQAEVVTGVGERAVALVAEVAVGALEAADEKVLPSARAESGP